MDCSGPHIVQGHKKRKRHRKKQIFSLILKQMEFYFSDAALIKDRLLSQLIDKDPFVPLDVFLTFNKIKSLTHKTSDIAQALQASKFLELSEDNAKVRRITSLVPYDVDARTIYVESIPYKADIEWLTNIFQTYGTVAYVSLPKYYKTNRIKGFAFIEFEKEEDAKKCLEAFIEMGCKMPTNIKAESLASCQGFQPDVASNDGEHNLHTYEDKPLCDEPASKKFKKSEDCDAEELPKNDSMEECVTEHSESANEQDNCRAEEIPSTVVNPARKRKKKEKMKPEKERDKNIDISAKSLQVLSKCEWKVLRNKYLDIQRKHMKALKKVLKTHHTLPENKNQLSNDSVGINPDQQSDMRLNQKLTEISFVEGVIAKVELEEPCINVKEFKKSTKENVNVVFVDVKEGDSVAYIRLKDCDVAKQFYCSGIFPKVEILKGKDESDYWEIIKRQQYEKATSKRKIRGRDRLVNKATQLMESTPVQNPPGKHIRFDE